MANKRPKKTAHNGAHRQTDGHGDSMTESAQLGRFSENTIIFGAQQKETQRTTNTGTGVVNPMSGLIINR